MQKQEATKKVQALLKQMTLAEKIAQLDCYWMYDLQTKGKLDTGKVSSLLANGIGQITRIGGASTIPPSRGCKNRQSAPKISA